MYTSMEGSCSIENFQLFSNFQWGFKDKDMVRLNVCPLVNSVGWTASSIMSFYSKKCVKTASWCKVKLWVDWNRASAVDRERGQTFWPTISPQWDPKCFRGRGRQWLSPSMSAAWVIQESYSQVKLWPFNGTYCKGICWSLSRGTNSFICRGTASMFAQVGHSVWISDPSQCISGEKLFGGFLVVLHSGGLLRWKHAQSSQLGKDSAIIWQIPSLPLAHAC